MILQRKVWIEQFKVILCFGKLILFYTIGLIILGRSISVSVTARNLPIFQASSSIESCSFLNSIRINANGEGLDAITNSLVRISRCQSHGRWRWEFCTADFRVKGGMEIARIAVSTESLNFQVIISIALGVQVRSVGNVHVSAKSPTIGIGT